MEMRAELVINAPAEDAWVVVGGRFGDIGEWASAITESFMDGPPAVGRVLEKVLAGHEPCPAWVIRQPLTIVRANTGAGALFPGLTQLTPDELIDLWYGPGPF